MTRASLFFLVSLTATCNSCEEGGDGDGGNTEPPEPTIYAYPAVTLQGEFADGNFVGSETWEITTGETAATATGDCAYTWELLDVRLNGGNLGFIPACMDADFNVCTAVWRVEVGEVLETGQTACTVAPPVSQGDVYYLGFTESYFENGTDLGPAVLGFENNTWTRRDADVEAFGSPAEEVFASWDEAPFAL